MAASNDNGEQNTRRAGVPSVWDLCNRVHDRESFLVFVLALEPVSKP
jgi:hypothetical protein